MKTINNDLLNQISGAYIGHLHDYHDGSAYSTYIPVIPPPQHPYHPCVQPSPNPYYE